MNNQLNSNQLKAVTSTTPTLRIIAGAGTGKTTVLTSRYKHLIQTCKIPYSKILVVVFNTNAKYEIINRLADVIDNPQEAWIHTYHSFCFKVLKEEYGILKISKYFETYSSSDKLKIFKDILKHFKDANNSNVNNEVTEDYELDREEIRNIQEKISKFKYKYCLPNNLLLEKINLLLEKNTSSKDNKFYKIFAEYLTRQSSKSELDFDDYIINTHYLFKNYPNICEKYSNMFEHILMDEFQDIDMTQYEIFKFLRKENKNIFLVGDPDQCIYEWRNANSNIILSTINDDFPKLETIILNENYRSYQFILDAANNVISNNKLRVEGDKKFLYTSKKNSGKIVFNKYNYAEDEASDIIKKIQGLLRIGTIPGQIAILYRNNYLSGAIEKILRSANVEYKILNNISFFERVEIKLSLGYFKLLFRDSDVQLEYVINRPSRSIGEVTWNKLNVVAENNNISLSELLFKNKEILFKEKMYPKINLFVDTINKYRNIFKVSLNNAKEIKTILAKYLKEVGMVEYIDKISANKEEKDKRILNIASLVDLIVKDYLENNNQILLENNLVDLVHNDTDNHDSVVISTIHGVKGLEFEHVFLIAASDEILSCEDDPKKLEQDRRLTYVAFTRAKKQLYLSYHVQPTFFMQKAAKLYYYKPSRFIREAKIK